MIIENSEIKIKEEPLLIDLYPISVLNSLWRFNNILFHNMKWRDGINQNLVGINNNPIDVLIQFKDILLKVDGSKTEKRLVIIFSL